MSSYPGMILVSIKKIELFQHSLTLQIEVLNSITLPVDFLPDLPKTVNVLILVHSKFSKIHK